MASEGATVAIIGPSLPDLALLYNVSLETLAFVLLLFNGAGVVGNVVIPTILRRASIYQLLAAMSLMTSVFYFVVPFARNVYVMLLVTTLQGTVTFPALNVVFLKMSTLWPGNPRPYYVAMEVSALGAVLGPLILAPFLSDGTFTRSINANSYNVSTLVNRSSDEYSVSMGVLTNTSEYGTGDARPQGVLTTMGIAWGIFGVFSIPLAMTFFWFHYMEKSVHAPVETNVKSDYEPLEEDIPKTPRNGKEYLLIGVLVVYVLDGQAHGSFASLLPTYGVKRLNMGAELMSFMTSMFWFAFLLGRLVPCFLTSKFNQFLIIVVNNVGMCAAFVLLIFAMGNSTFLWISSFLAGLFYGPRMPANFAWSKKLIEDTPRIVSLKFVSVAIGATYAYIVDEVMNRVDLDAFVYMHIGLYLFSALMLFCILILCRVLKIKVCV